MSEQRISQLENDVNGTRASPGLADRVTRLESGMDLNTQTLQERGELVRTQFTDFEYRQVEAERRIVGLEQRNDKQIRWFQGLIVVIAVQFLQASFEVSLIDLIRLFS